MKKYSQRHLNLGVDWVNHYLCLDLIHPMPEVKELERNNLHSQMWTSTIKGETSQFDKIFKGGYHLTTVER